VGAVLLEPQFQAPARHRSAPKTLAWADGGAWRPGGILHNAPSRTWLAAQSGLSPGLFTGTYDVYVTEVAPGDVFVMVMNTTSVQSLGHNNVYGEMMDLFSPGFSHSSPSLAGERTPFSAQRQVYYWWEGH
jgi:hypothetical protein